MKRVCILLMEFPVPSETFASNEISLLDKNLSLVVGTIKKTRAINLKLVKERQLENIRYISSITTTRWVLFITNLKIFCYLLSQILRAQGRFKKEWFKQLILVPKISVLSSKIFHEKISIVHLFWGHYPSLAGLALKRLRPDILCTQFLGAYDLDLELPLSLRFAKDHADVVFTHSQYGKEKLIELGVPARKIEVFLRGIDLRLIEQVRNELEVTRISGTAMSAGRLIREKCFESCIQLASSSPFIQKFELFGSGPDDLRLRRFMSSLETSTEIAILPHTDQLSLFRAYFSSEFFVFFSEKSGEILPNVVKEAMACGCIVLCKRMPAIEELITNGKNGFIVDDVMQAIKLVSTLTAREKKTVSKN
ncbi:glycosyltransferase, partial [Litorivicinus sp.]|nr:glycosyltransferase [Litorivicinus sp.]